MRRASVFAAASLACVLNACGQGGPTGATPAGGAGASAGATGNAGTGAAGATAGTGGGGAGTAGTAAAGASGTTGGAGAAGTGASADAGTTDAEPARDAPAESGGDASADGAAPACAAPAFICDDFEKYAAGATDLSPDWITYTYSGTVRVDATKPRAGKQSLHLTTQAGLRHYADLLRETRDQELLPRRHFGRMMVWLTAVPPSAHWNLTQSSGPMVGAPNELAKFLEGGMFGKVMSNYAQRGRVMVDGQYPPRGGGPQQGDPGADADCAVAAPTQKVMAGRWVCWEWEFDGTTDATTAHLWLDGQAMTEIDAVGAGKQCQGPGFGGKPMMPMYRWETPRVFDKLMIGYEQYQDTPAQELWIDDVVMSRERVGCPTP
jgi:hypothetical protein